MKNSKISYDIKKIFTDYSNGDIGDLYSYLIINRIFLFPIVLSTYMIYLLIGQTKLFGLDTNIFYINIQPNLLLGTTIFSGILTIFQEEKDELYKKIIPEENIKKGHKIKKLINFNILLIIFLSLLGTYIIYTQTVKLELLSYIISIISGLLIFFVGISINEAE